MTDPKTQLQAWIKNQYDEIAADWDEYNGGDWMRGGRDVLCELEKFVESVPDFTTEWGLRKHGQDKPRHCTEHAAWLAAPDETPVSRVVGPWQGTTPNPPAERSQADVRD